MIFYQEPLAALYQGDAKEVLEYLPPESVDCCITSPPYWGLRDYKANGQLGLEKTPEEYVAKMVQVFREVRRVLKKEGTCWLNLGDSYNGLKNGSTQENVGAKRHNTNSFTKPLWEKLKPKDLVGIPWRCAFALQSDGWWLRQDIIWSKPNPMPESVTDRCTKSHEYIFLLAKSAKYYYDAEAIKEKSIDPESYEGMRERPQYVKGYPEEMGENNFHKLGGVTYPTRNKRSVWEITTKPYKDAHFATFPPDLIQPMVMAGCPVNGIIIDPFAGSGTTLAVAKTLNRKSIGIELNPDYCKLCVERLQEIPIPMELGV